ncbi:MAG: BspA family leucine-rich repeat surface protein [Candidatus Paceibacteria bacterium]
MSNTHYKVSQGVRVTIVTSLIFLFTFFLTTQVSHAQVTPGDPGNFITTWNTENPGTTANNQIRITHTTGTYNYDLYWVNVASSTLSGTTTVSGVNGASSPTITLPEPGIYQVEIAGDFPRIFFNNSGDRQKILAVNQWGDIEWSSMLGAFFGAVNLRIPAVDAPDLGTVTTLENMFLNATSFNDSVNHWDVSGVTLMNNLFSLSGFNQPLNNWDVSSVTNMNFTFNQTPFNQDISNWNVSSVNTFQSTFRQSNFNQDISNWNVSKGTNFSGAFRENSDFNQDLSSWNISSSTNMTNMFLNSGLSQPNLDSTLSSWATQATNLNKTNIPLHIGLKSYSSTGAAAIATLQGLGWTITEQYQATYSPSTRATLLGSGLQSTLNSGDTTTAVEIRPDHKCTFTRWSDGNTDNPRQDTLTDNNLAVSAIIHCPSSGGTTLATRITNLENSGNQAEADKLRAQFQLTTTTTTTQTTPVTLEDTLTTLRSLLEQPLPTDPENQSKAKELLSLLLELVKALSQLLLTTALTTSEVSTEEASEAVTEGE